MSEILSEDVIETVFKKKRKLIGIKCDRCERVIPVMVYGGVKDDSQYYSVTTGHHNWGSESDESIEQFDICPGCIVGFVSNYLSDKKYSTAYIDIERNHAYPQDRWEQCDE